MYAIHTVGSIISKSMAKLSDKSWNAEETLFHYSLTDTNYALRPPVRNATHRRSNRDLLFVSHLTYSAYQISDVPTSAKYKQEISYDAPTY